MAPGHVALGLVVVLTIGVEDELGATDALLGYLVEVVLGEARREEEGPSEEPRPLLREVVGAPFGQHGQVLEQARVWGAQGKTGHVELPRGDQAGHPAV